MKRGATLSLSVALAFGVFACPNLSRAASPQSDQAMNAPSTQSSSQARQEASQMVPATVHLKKTLDAHKVHPGDSFEAVLQQNVQLKNGPKLDSGTVLVGKVTADQTGQDHARLALCFNQAKMKNGQAVPIKATVIQIAQPAGLAGTGTNIADQSTVWTPETVRVDQIGAISNVDLHSAIASQNSAVLESKKDDIKLSAGEQMRVVIAARQSQEAMSSVSQ